mmetsp:Transcript_72467/g.169851  ORF Transcript_72467/g.169851 Transcript_72467/m.169851 type:complete len:210 (+) Transcript_72467:519-1148(+)
MGGGHHDDLEQVIDISTSCVHYDRVANEGSAETPGACAIRVKKDHGGCRPRFKRLVGKLLLQLLLNFLERAPDTAPPICQVLRFQSFQNRLREPLLNEVRHEMPFAAMAVCDSAEEPLWGLQDEEIVLVRRTRLLPALAVDADVMWQISELTDVCVVDRLPTEKWLEGILFRHLAAKRHHVLRISRRNARRGRMRLLLALPCLITLQQA